MNSLSCGPQIDNRLFQGAFSFQSVPSSEVVMTTSPSDRILKNVGMGLVVYGIDEAGAANVSSETLSQSIEKLASIPLLKICK